MNLETKRNQQFTNLILDESEEKLNTLITQLDKKHKTKLFKEKVVEDQAHIFDGISYEMLTLSKTILNKIQHINDNLISALSELIISPQTTKVEQIKVDLPTKITELPGLEGQQVIISEPQIIKENKSEPEIKRKPGFQKGHTLSKKVGEDGL